MNLTEIFYGTFVPPKATSVRTHKMGFAELPKYVPLKYKNGPDMRPFEERLSKSAKQVLKLLRAQVKPITGSEMAKKIPYTRNYCSQIMSTFVKERLAKRIRVKKPNTRLYAYMAIKND